MSTNSKNHVVFICATILGAVVLAGAGAYAGMSYYYSNKFFPGTTINSFECGDLTVSQCEELIRQKVENYSLTVDSRGFEPQQISAETIDYKYAPDGQIQQLMSEQNSFEWVKGYLYNQEYTVGENVSYDKDKLKEQLEQMECMQPENQVQPEDARIEFQGNLFTIVAGQEGSALDENKALDALYAAVESTEQEVNLEDAGAYLEPNVREDDESLVERLKIINTYAKSDITLVIGTQTENLNGTIIKDWYSQDAHGDLYLDGEVLKGKLQEFVAELASKYNTLGVRRSFTTTDGRTVTVSGGNYGWQINQSAEVEQLYQEILGGQQVSREPNYSSYGRSFDGSNDIGNTYIEVDLGKQHMYFYKEGSVVFESDFVSGDMSQDDRKTPTGVCHMVYKKQDFVLRGEKKPDGTYEYESPVKYWMPFNGGVGFHDASWRSEFGGEIYKTNGSHGCINLPSAKAEQLYGIIDESIPIVVFY